MLLKTTSVIQGFIYTVTNIDKVKLLECHVIDNEWGFVKFIFFQLSRSAGCVCPCIKYCHHQSHVIGLYSIFILLFRASAWHNWAALFPCASHSSSWWQWFITSCCSATIAFLSALFTFDSSWMWYISVYVVSLFLYLHNVVKYCLDWHSVSTKIENKMSLLARTAVFMHIVFWASVY